MEPSSKSRILNENHPNCEPDVRPGFVALGSTVVGAISGDPVPRHVDRSTSSGRLIRIVSCTQNYGRASRF